MLGVLVGEREKARLSSFNWLVVENLLHLTITYLPYTTPSTYRVPHLCPTLWQRAHISNSTPYSADLQITLHGANHTQLCYVQVKITFKLQCDAKWEKSVWIAPSPKVKPTLPTSETIPCTTRMKPARGITLWPWWPMVRQTLCRWKMDTSTMGRRKSPYTYPGRC